MDISKVANDYSFTYTYLEPTAISLSISRQLQVFLSSCRYSQPTAIIVIYAHQLSWLQILNLIGFWFQSDCPGNRKYFTTSSHNSSHLFPPNLSLHLLQCNSNTFNSNSCICFKETTIISIQLHQFWSNCTRFNPLQTFWANCNYFNMTAATF